MKPSGKTRPRASNGSRKAGKRRSKAIDAAAIYPATLAECYAEIDRLDQLMQEELETQYQLALKLKRIECPGFVPRAGPPT